MIKRDILQHSPSVSGNGTLKVQFDPSISFTDDAPRTLIGPMGATVTLAIVLATVVVLAGSIGAVKPTHTMTGHLHNGIVVDETGQEEESSVLEVSALEVSGEMVVAEIPPTVVGIRPLSLLLSYSLLPLVSCLERDLDFLRGTPSES